MALAPERSSQEPASVAAAPAWEPGVVEEVLEEIPRRLPRLDAREFIQAGFVDEARATEGFDDAAEEEEIIKLLECTNEAENLFMVSPVPFLIQSPELLS